MDRVLDYESKGLQVRILLGAFLINDLVVKNKTGIN